MIEGICFIHLILNFLLTQPKNKNESKQTIFPFVPTNLADIAELEEISELEV